MIDIDTALREMTETEESVEDMVLSDRFRNELSRIRLDLKVSPHLPISDEMCKWVVLAYLRSAHECATNSRRKPLTDEEIESCMKQAYATVRGRNLEHAFARAIERAHGIGGEE